VARETDLKLLHTWLFLGGYVSIYWWPTGILDSSANHGKVSTNL